ncbi:MAG: S8 family peptidase [bacterium]
MKLKHSAQLFAAAMAVYSLGAFAQQSLSTGFSGETVKPGTTITVKQSPQLIIKFASSQAFNVELGAVEAELAGMDRDSSQYQALYSQARQNLEQQLIQEGKDRVLSLSSNYGVNASYERTLATGADLVSIKAKITSSRNGGIQELIKKLQSDPAIESVELNARMQPLFTPNDTLYNSQWHYHEATAGMNVDNAWDSSTGAGAVVAVIDTGYRPHVDLVGNILPGYDFISDSAGARDGNGRDSDAQDQGDWAAAGECYSGSPASNSSWHGTHVAGTVAAVTNNNQGVAGVAYNAKVVPVRVLGKCGGTLADIADAIIWASGGAVSGIPNNANPADAINMSLGGSGACDATYQSAINTAVANGTTVVVAAGNENQNASNSRPANCSNVIAVAALDRQGNRAFYSNYGAVVDVAAPGGETTTSTNGIRSTLNAGTTTPGADSYAYYQGTSMATPHVAGAVALMKSVNAGMTPAQIETELKNTVRAIPGSCSGGCGAGLVDAAAAVLAASGGGGGGGTTGPTVLNNGDSVSGLGTATGNALEYKIAIPAGATNLQVNISGGTGDADLYVKAGSAPTSSSYDCRPYKSGNAESCSFASPTTGDYFINIQAYNTFSGVTLSVSYTAPSGGGGGGTGTTVINNGDTLTNLSGAASSWTHYKVSVPAGATDLQINMSGGTGDADLYVKFGAEPTSSSYDCRPYKSGNTESCTFATTSEGDYFISINAYSAYSGMSLSVSYTEAGGSTGGGGTVNNISATKGNWNYYTVTVPAGMAQLKVDISGGTGDADLYVRLGSQPTTSSYDCRPYKSGNTETCTFANPAAGTWHIGIRAYATYSGVTLDAYYTP